MQQVGDLTTNNKKDIRWPAISISHSLLATLLLEPTLEEPSRYRSRILFIREEPSYQASLMAGAHTLGPSDTPCLVETSTAHGELLFLDTSSLNGATKLLWFPSFASNLGQISQSPTFHSPEMPEPPQNPSSSSYGRRTQISPLSAKVKLGFQLVGLSKFSPLRSMKPNYKRCDPIQFLQKPRSVPKSILSIFSQSLCRFTEPVVRRHQLERNPPLLLCLHKNSMRTLPLSPRDIGHGTKSLKKNDILFMIPRSGCHRSFLNSLSSLSLNTKLNQVLTSNICEVMISLNYQEVFKNLEKDLEPLPHRILPDYRTVILFFLAVERLALLVPARISAMESFSTSHCLLTVTIVSSNASPVDEPLTNRVITCANLLPSYCLQAFMDPSSNYFTYPFVAIEIVVLCVVLSFVILVSLATLNLVLI